MDENNNPGNIVFTNLNDKDFLLDEEQILRLSIQSLIVDLEYYNMDEVDQLNDVSSLEKIPYYKGNEENVKYLFKLSKQIAT